MPLRYVASMLLGGLSDFGRRCSDVQLVTAASTRTTRLSLERPYPSSPRQVSVRYLSYADRLGPGDSGLS